MHYKIIFFLGVLFLCSCKTSQLAEASDLIQIKQNMKKQESAWNTGSIDEFMLHYWNSPELTFIGSRGITKGWQLTLDNYKKSYPDTKTMGRLEFDIQELRALGPTSAYMIGKYTLYRSEDQPSGYFNLIWEKINGQWVITSDHTGG